MIVYAAVHGETRDIRPGEALPWNALADYLRTHLETRAGGSGAREMVGLDLSAPMQVLQFPGGHSNLTYLVRFGNTELVVRRPPLGPVAPKAHDMAREYRCLAAIHPVFPLAPEPYLLCEDPDVIGTTFYVMERRRGLVVRHDEPSEIAGNSTARLRVSQAMIDALAELHAIDVSSGALAAIGKPAGFLARQVRGWTERWEGSKTMEVPEMDAAASWLAARIPADPVRPSIVHGDFKLDNVMIDPLDVGRLVAVLDWEMSALGDPLVDLGILLAYWAPSNSSGSKPESKGTGAADALSTVTDRRGWFTRDAILERYTLRSGRDVSSIRFYEVFARFKIAAVIQQIYFRFVTGQTDDPRFATFGDRVMQLARTATVLAGE